MFARNAKAVLILVLAVLVSNGTMLLSPPFHPAQGHLIQDHEYRQSKRQTSFGNQVTDRWLLYARDDDIGGPTFEAKRHPAFDYPPSRSAWRKRTLRHDDDPHAGFHKPDNLPPPGNRPSQRILRTSRNHRTYDVPQIECPRAEDGMDRFACPTPDRMGRYRCIDDHVLCDGFIDCPNAEDEERQACMFYKTTKAHLDVIADAVLRWARGR